MRRPYILYILTTGMLACTHTDISSLHDVNSKSANGLCNKNKAAAPVVASKPPIADTSAELPFFKDVLDAKRLFW